MNIKTLSIIFSFIVITGLLFFQASRTGTAVVYVPTELSAQGDLKRIRVGGRVSDKIKVEYQTEPSIELKFAIINPGLTTEDTHTPVPVIYKGIKPDMFAAGRDVIIDGDFTDGTILANELLTQCPSKYEPPKPHNSYQPAEDVNAG